jgi:alkanesulfonate monooxygenase SsuD/methylene tetrahydromethanopterin reductase-like flavin-dependent oxidoreductase (luciferase family)
MLRLAGRQADGVIINWLTPNDVPRVVGIARDAARAEGRDPADLEVASRVFVCMHDDIEIARATARRQITAYLNVPVYRGFHEWLGNDRLLGPMWQKWDAGDRRGALAAISDEAVDSLVAAGDAARCRDLVQAFASQGVETPIMYWIPTATDVEGQARESWAMLRALAPRSS